MLLYYFLYVTFREFYSALLKNREFNPFSIEISTGLQDKIYKLKLSFELRTMIRMQEKEVKRVVVADSQFLIIEGLKSILKTENHFAIQSIVSSKTGLTKVLRERKPDLLIADIQSTIDFGLDDLIKLKKEFEDLPVLILTNSLSKVELNSLISVGVRNIIYKSAEKEELLLAIELTLQGRKYLCEEIMDMLLEPSETPALNDRSGKLTNSEIEIVKLIAEGLTAKEIAVKKNLSIHTVNTHRKNIFRKMEVSNTSELIILAIKSGWIDNIEYYI